VSANEAQLMKTIYAVTESIHGNYQTSQVKNKPYPTHGLASVTETVLKDCQLVFWYPQELPVETARWMAKDVAVDLKRKLSDYTK
jgi:hypothetical protein